MVSAKLARPGDCNHTVIINIATIFVCQMSNDASKQIRTEREFIAKLISNRQRLIRSKTVDDTQQIDAKFDRREDIANAVKNLLDKNIPIKFANQLQIFIKFHFSKFLPNAPHYFSHW
jgi:hypothetical protein